MTTSTEILYCAIEMNKKKLFQLFLTTIDGLNPMSANIWLFFVAFENEIDGEKKERERLKEE